jgi:hypothetical protein
MVFKICRDHAEISPVQRFSARIQLPEITPAEAWNFDRHLLIDSCGDSDRVFRQREVDFGTCRRSCLSALNCHCSGDQFIIAVKRWMDFCASKPAWDHVHAQYG